MGKRRTDGPHRDRYAGNDSDDNDDVEETILEQEPLKEDQIASIKSRKKLVAKRRGPNSITMDSSSSGPFGSLIKTTSLNTGSEETSEKGAPSIFSGFKGFSAFKASSDTTLATSSTAIINQPVSQTINSIFSSTSTSTNSFANNSSETKTASPFSSSIFSTKPAPTATNTNMNTQVTNGDHKSTTENKSSESIKTINSTSTNISELEINFINDLNDLYEKHYGKNKRNLKLPDEIMNVQDESTLKNGNVDIDESSKKKYGYLLAELNKHCSKWISKHVEEDPLIILTPIFVDYFNYLILLEKNFYPNTFKQSKTVGLQPSSSVTTGTSSFTGFNGSSIFKTTNGTENNHKFSNGHKEADIEEKKQADKENEREEDREVENDKNFIDSSKKFASLIKGQTQQLNPISLTNSNSFLFKPNETNTTTKLAEKDSNSPQTITTPSLFKFGNSNTTPLADSSKTITTEEPKVNIFGSSNLTTPTNIAPSFKFGADLSKKSDQPVATPSEEKSEASSSIFSNLVKSSQPSDSSKVSTTPTFASLMNNNASQTPESSSSSSSIFKPFAGFDAFQSKPSLFSTATVNPISAISSSTTNPISSSTTSTTEAPKPFFSFQTATNSSGATGGIFGSLSQPSSSIFGNSTFPTSVLNTNAGGDAGEADEEEYVPPKPEVSDVKEEGAVYTKRMKLYYYNEKETKFCDRGIGNLYIKPINNGESTQLIIRADNSLANILLNVKLNKMLPVSKIGAKDVSMLCIPNPAIPNVDSKLPCKFLFKVKTEEDAVELLDKLNEFKK